jgi:hypothetical protein
MKISKTTTAAQCICLVMMCIAMSSFIITVHAGSLLPSLPCEFYGNVTINGGGAPAGMDITAFINGEQRGIITILSPGRYGGPAKFDQRLVVTGTEDEYGRPVIFRINGVEANETAVFTPGYSSHLDLNVFQAGPLPTAYFTMNQTSGIAPLPVKFIDVSDCVNTTGRLWNFGGGDTSPVRDPVYTYLQPGIYVPRLTVTNSTGSNTTIPDQSITVFPKGDFNMNNRVDIGDVTYVAYDGVGFIIPVDLRADFNGDGFVDAGDAAKIAWYYVGKIPVL